MLRWRYLLVAPILAAAVTAIAIGGASLSTGTPRQAGGASAGRVVGSTGGEALAESSNSGEYIPTGPELSLKEVGDIATREAARDQLGRDESPVTISVARAEANVALEALNGVSPTSPAVARTAAQYAGRTVPPGSTPRQVSESPAEHKPDFVVVAHGNFELRGMPVPPGEALPTGDVLTLAIDAHTGYVEAIGVDERVPDLDALGPVVSLNEGEANQKEETPEAAPEVKASEPNPLLEEIERREKKEAAEESARAE